MNIDNDEQTDEVSLDELFDFELACDKHKTMDKCASKKLLVALKDMVETELATQRQALRDEVEKAILSFIHPSVATTPEAQKAINTAISTIFEGKEQPNE